MSAVVTHARSSEVHAHVPSLLCDGAFRGSERKASCSWGVVNWPSDKVRLRRPWCCVPGMWRAFSAMVPLPGHCCNPLRSGCRACRVLESQNEDKFAVAAPPLAWRSLNAGAASGGGQSSSVFGGFAVFDGHAGRGAAVECSLHMFDKARKDESAALLTRRCPFLRGYHVCWLSVRLMSTYANFLSSTRTATWAGSPTISGPSRSVLLRRPAILFLPVAHSKLTEGGLRHAFADGRSDLQSI